MFNCFGLSDLHAVTVCETHFEIMEHVNVKTKLCKNFGTSYTSQRLNFNHTACFRHSRKLRVRT
jgi:hypothetical protein